MSPDEELRAAATLLRDTATRATPGPWGVESESAHSHGIYSYPGHSFAASIGNLDADEYAQHVARWIALLNPELAEPLAAWLEETANVMTWLGPVKVQPVEDGAGLWDGMGTPRTEWDRALAFARAINGGAK